MVQKPKTQNLHTPEGRVSFPHVFEKSEYSGKYELTLIFPKGTDLTKMKAAATTAARERWGTDIPPGLRSPFRTVSEKIDTYGEDFDPDDIFVSFRSMNRPPQIVDAVVNPIMDKGEFYPGCWARVSCNVYAYPKKGGKDMGNRGVAFGLVNIQKVRDDDPLAGSGVKAEEEFDPLEGGAGDPAAYDVETDDIFGDSNTPPPHTDDDIPF